ncbi:MAG: hypothetical protein DRM99_06080 [Thermoplasmata archaeon]|nr:MAG: hypothetical protein DRM99_06080 [Thermoplasmata archaeon]
MKSDKEYNSVRVKYLLPEEGADRIISNNMKLKGISSDTGLDMDVNGSIDMHGNILINTTFNSNSNEYTFYSDANITTTNATPTTILSMPLITGTNYVEIKIVGRIDTTATSYCERVTYKISFDGSTAVSNEMERVNYKDPAFLTAGSTSAINITTTDIEIQVTGIAATTVKWFCVAKKIYI